MGESAGVVGEVPPEGFNPLDVRLAATLAILTVADAVAAGCAVAEAGGDELAGELADADGDVEVDSAAVDGDVPEGVLEEGVSSPFAVEFRDGWPAVVLVRGADGFGFGVWRDADPERGAPVDDVLWVSVGDVVPEGVLEVDPLWSIAEGPVAPSVPVAVSCVDGFGFGVRCDAGPEPVAGDEVLSALVDDDEPAWLVVSARAAPVPVQTAAPTPKATANPPTRPIYREAPMLPP